MRVEFSVGRFERPRGHRVHGASYEALEELAVAARWALFPQVAIEDPIDMMEAYERLGEGAVLPTEWIGPTSVLMDVKPFPQDSLEAITEHIGDHAPGGRKFAITLSDGTYRGLTRDDPTAGFTLAHEIGHVMRHGRILRALRVLPDRQRMLARARSAHPIFEDAEWQADVFAGAFLAPAAGVAARAALDGVLGAQLLHFGLSRSAAQARARVLRERPGLQTVRGGKARWPAG